MRKSPRSLSSSVSARLHLQHHRVRLLSRPTSSVSTYPCSRLLARPVRVHTQMAIKLPREARRLIVRMPCRPTASIIRNLLLLLNVPTLDLPILNRATALVLSLPAIRLSSLILNIWPIVLPGYHPPLLQVIHRPITMVVHTSTRTILLARDP